MNRKNTYLLTREAKLIEEHVEKLEAKPTNWENQAVVNGYTIGLRAVAGVLRQHAAEMRARP